VTDGQEVREERVPDESGRMMIEEKRSEKREENSLNRIREKI
jgi:hypothetical protein